MAVSKRPRVVELPPPAAIREPARRDRFFLELFETTCAALIAVDGARGEAAVTVVSEELDENAAKLGALIAPWMQDATPNSRQFAAFMYLVAEASWRLIRAACEEAVCMAEAGEWPDFGE